jgi:RNA polymerase subunit RPABC4/transcription elongation factor Spt4
MPGAFLAEQCQVLVPTLAQFLPNTYESRKIAEFDGLVLVVDFELKEVAKPQSVPSMVVAKNLWPQS